MNSNIRNTVTFVSSGVSLLLWSCATVAPPKELVDARNEYQKSSYGPVSKLNPAGLYEAKKSLDTAEKAFQQDPESEYTHDTSYIALRKIQLVEAQTNILMANQEKAKADQDKQKTTEVALAQTKTKLSQSEELRREGVGDLNRSKDALSTEKEARENAERQAEEATANLARIASVKQEQRGLVITLSGSILFTSGQATILADARPKLDEIALALQKSEGNTFVVEGHTDSRGSESFNQDLSVRRAQSVRDYLVDRGVPSGKIRAAGFGKSRPVTENDTAEGRANNRRVEIVIEPHVASY